MPKPVILVFIDWFLPGYKAGGPVSSCANLVEHLRAEFEFRIVTRNTDYTESEPYPGIRPNTWIEREEGVYVYYFSQDQLRIGNIKKLISQTRPDKVYLNGIYSRYFTLYPLLLLNRKKNMIVVAARGMLASSAIAVKKKKKTFFLGIVGLARLFRNVTFHATNPDEVNDIRKQFGQNCHVLLAGNLAPGIIQKENKRRTKEQGSLSLISVARIAPEKNLLFALRVLRKIRTCRISFQVYGPVYDLAYFKQCEEEMKELSSNIKVSFKGSIEPERVHGMLSECHGLWMPTRGENFGHIIVQSWAAGCPVVISDQTPWHNLSEKGLGWDIPLTNPEEFVQTLETFAGMSQTAFDNLSDTCVAFAAQRAADTNLVEDNKRLFR
ncbi:MAG: glycosyltransferase family 4 protein [Bacteroidia bacterium]